MIIIKHEAIINNIRLLKYEYEHIGIKDYCYVEPSDSGNYAVIIHGHGSNADQLYTREDIFECWYPELKKHNFGIICFDTQGNGWMNKYVVWAMEKMVKFLKKEYSIKNTVFIGGSMGGTSVLIYTLYHPEDPDAVISNCPASNLRDYFTSIRSNTNPILDEIRDTIKERYEGNPEENFINIPKSSGEYVLCNANEHTDLFTMPLYVAHGNEDEIIPFAFTEKLIDQMKGKDNFTYTVIDRGNHDSPLYLLPRELDWVCKKLNI